MKFRNAAFAESTKSAYRSQLKHYIKFCNRHNCNLAPISPQFLLRYVVYLAHTLSANSIRQYLNVIRLIHLEMGFSNPLTQDEWVQHSLKSVVCGIKRIKGAPVNRKLPITVQILKQMYSLLNRYSSLDMTFWAACLVAFFGMLRKSSLFPAPGRPVYLTLDHGIGETLCRWIESWLTEREQRVVVNGKVSEWGSVGSGVPQGSVLGPTAFLVYINDLDIEIKNDILKFADDTKLFAAIRSDEDAVRLQDDVNKLYEWSKKWQMNFNVDKCKCVHIGRNNKDHGYYIGDNIVQESSSEKDLGVIVESTMDWGKQCANVARSGNMMLSQINRTFTYKTGSLIKNLYKSLVRPKFDYCMQAWRPWLQQDVTLLEKVQRRMTRMIPELRQQPYQVRLRKLGLTTLETRRRRADLIEVYRMFNGLDDIDPKLFFVSQEGCSTRGHRLKILKQRARLDVRKYCFSHRVVNDWNNLPARAIESNTLNEFKGYVDNYLRKYSEDYTSQRVGGSLPRQSPSF